MKGIRLEAFAQGGPGDAGSAREVPQKLPAHYLHPGQLYASMVSTEITTILGSCIAVCLWSPRSGAGGMNHFLLPTWASGETASPRYGNVAVERLLERLASFGLKPGDLRAKLFGGSSMLDALKARHDQLGQRNAEVAFELLRLARIPVLAHDIGGKRGRKIVFRTDDGSVLVKLL